MIRTYACRNQNPVPYHLANTHNNIPALTLSSIAFRHASKRQLATFCFPRRRKPRAKKKYASAVKHFVFNGILLQKRQDSNLQPSVLETETLTN